MKKILMLFDGNNFPEGAFRFVKELQEREPVFVTAGILHPLNFEEIIPTVFAVSAQPYMELQEEAKLDYSRAKDHFTEACTRNGIEHSIHEESIEWNISELIKETRFADFVVMSEEIFFTGAGADQPNAFTEQFLIRSECPVMLFPEGYSSFKEIIITYDGTKDSLFALKEFLFLFPELKSIPARIVYAHNDSNLSMPDMDYLTEYAGRHLGSLEIEKLQFNEKKFFLTWLEKYPGALVISGSFGSAGIMGLLKKSFAAQLINRHQHPLFIAHK